MSVVTKEEITEVGGKRESSCKEDRVSAGASMQNQVGNVMLFGIPIVSLVMDGKERLCLAQISSTLLKEFSYNEIHNRRVALGINCVQCTPVQLEILRRAGAMPVTSRRCGMITRREAERLCKSFLGDHAPPQLPENFAFDVYHECGWGCRGSFVPSRYNSSRAKCIRCSFCQLFFSPNKFIFHSHRLPESRYVQPDAANFNSWRRHMKLCGDPPEEANSSNSISDMATAQIVHAWEDVKAMFNGGTRKRLLAASTAPSTPSGRHGSGMSSGKGSNAGSKASQNHHHSSNQHGQGGEGPNNNSRGSLGAGGNGGGAHSKKEQAISGSVSSSSGSSGGVSAPHHQSLGSVLPSSTPYNNTDAAHLQTSPNFLHQAAAAAAAQHNPFLNVSNPLISPGGRLTDAIWNPALQASAARQCPPPFPSLPFHPLSIPWLRRPLFPFSHPFGPSLIADQGTTGGGDVGCAEKLTSTSRQSQSSAFKPVSRNPVEPLFNWLNGNGFGIHPTPPSTSLPEDLSLHSPPPSGTSSTNLTPSANPNLLLLGSSPSTLEKTHHNRNLSSNNNNNSNSTKHQIQILSTAPQTESDSEENVDIESTVETEECSSTTSSVWVSSTTAALGGGGRGRGGSITPIHNNNNNNTITLKRKRLSTKTVATPTTGRSTSPQTYYSSGDDNEDERHNVPKNSQNVLDNDDENRSDDDDNSSIDNQDESYASSDNAKIHSPSSSSSPPHHLYQPQESSYSLSNRGKSRKRLWVNEIISTTDEDEEGGRQQQIMLVNSISKGSSNSSHKRNKVNYHNNHNSHHHQQQLHHAHQHFSSGTGTGAARFLLESPE